MRTKAETRALLKPIIKAITYRDWTLALQSIEGDRIWSIRWIWTDNCSITSKVITLESRKHSFDDRDCSDLELETEVVKLARGALHEALRHEADEFYQYKGKPLYNPHHTLASLLGVYE